MAVAIVVNCTGLAVDKVQTIKGFLNDDQVTRLNEIVVVIVVVFLFLFGDAVGIVGSIQHPRIVGRDFHMAGCGSQKDGFGRVIGRLYHLLVDLPIAFLLGR